MQASHNKGYLHVRNGVELAFSMPDAIGNCVKSLLRGDGYPFQVNYTKIGQDPQAGSEWQNRENLPDDAYTAPVGDLVTSTDRAHSGPGHVRQRGAVDERRPRRPCDEPHTHTGHGHGDAANDHLQPGRAAVGFRLHRMARDGFVPHHSGDPPHLPGPSR
jgi:hypothetical protein